MASLYKRRGTWHIDYRVNKKKITRNLWLPDTIRNKKLAENIKAEIEKEVEDNEVLITNDRNNQLNTNNSCSEKITLSLSISKYKHRMSLRSKSHQVLFEIVIKRLLEYISENSTVDEVTPEHVIAFIKSYRDEVSNSTLITYLNYLKGFFNFLIEDGYILKSPVRKKDLPKRERRNIVTFNEDMVLNILEVAKLRDIQFYQILMLMNLTGVRPNDIVRFHAGDFDFESLILNVTIAKTKKQIKFPIYHKLKHFIENEFPELRTMDKDQLLFPGYSVSRIGRKFRRIKSFLGITDRHIYTLKTFRKGFATQMSEILDIQYVAYLLGHDSPNTTVKYYSGVIVDKLRDKINSKNKLS